MEASKLHECLVPASLASSGMAMLDQKPCSATVTALKITREESFEIMADRPEIARTIFEVLSKRLILADEEIRQLACEVN